MSDKRIPCTITVQPWFQDHSVGGKIVLPAVETMLLLASRCLTVHPEIDIRVMENVRFGKFLEIPATVATVAALIECAPASDGRIQAKLLSHMQLGTMARIKEHGEIFFPLAGTNEKSHADIDPTPLTGSTTRKIDVKQLYRNLVPFGRLYQTLQETLYLSDRQAWGKLQAPELPLVYSAQAAIGSPFPLDGAMHAACVLGQDFVDFPPFPVGFDRRIIFRPTQPGLRYLTKVTMTSLTRDELNFDVTIFNNDGHLYETVTGLRMRDVRKAIKNQSG
ncbi:MAG: polyketide synthase dehydratase domain-containing protein [Proteobacteria bacterium]|nr:polyketide synthase dehydratase domain-containing protein [Pseudomonadota bacterium]